ncbi:29761_t:CDS:2, partial [Racocetra persica]
MESHTFYSYDETIEKPVYGYLLHNDEQRLMLLSQNPQMSAIEVAKNIANNWNALTFEQKNQYSERAKELNWKCLNE